ncbi:MAG: fatty acid--CoA ligase [Terriglobia bacterium]|jgi:fatty-acyl-CoA synthase|nr:fatty acid--CoA ligase [Terriglobia bacterium]
MNIPLTPIRFLRYAEQQFPNKVGVVCGDQRFTYAEFSSRIACLAGALRSLGVQPGDRVAFLSTNCHRLLEAYYGVPEAGAILLALNVRLSAQELTYVLNNSGAKILFFEDAFLPLVESFRDAVPQIKSFILQNDTPRPEWAASRTYDELIATAEPYKSDYMQIDENSVAELFYTSGTGANPKGVMLTHRNVYLHALSVIIGLGVNHDTVQLHTIPLFHANGWGAAHTVTLLGARHVMIHRFDPRDVFRLIEQEKVTCLHLVPTMAVALVNCPDVSKYDLSSLQKMNLGGAAASPTLVRQLEEKLGCLAFSGYGLTETSPVLTLATPKEGAHYKDERRYEQQARTGYPIPGVELRIVGLDDKDVPHDGQAMGEIWARGDGVMVGYWNDPESTARAFENGWFHTGDVATIDDDGYVLIMDRRKDMILSGGENISSLEVEKVIVAHPDVYEVAVIPVPDDRWGEVPKAVVVLKPDSHLSEAELIEFCRARLAHYKCPKSIDFVESLPKTGTGKFLKRELRKRYWR